MLCRDDSHRIPFSESIVLVGRETWGWCSNSYLKSFGGGGGDIGIGIGIRRLYGCMYYWGRVL